MDEDFHDDDAYLTHLGEVAEEMIAQEIDSPLDEIVAQNKGQLPKPLQQAMLLYVDYLYGGTRGSDNSNPEIPTAILHMCTLYRYWGKTR